MRHFEWGGRKRLGIKVDCRNSCSLKTGRLDAFRACSISPAGLGTPFALLLFEGQKELVQLLKNEVYVLKKQKGFSLIELLIVVAIILIIAAIAIPNLLRSRMAANEASAVGSIRTINTAAVTYSSTYPAAGYPSALSQLSPHTSSTR